MPPVGFEPTISADERPQTYVLDRAATGTGNFMPVSIENTFLNIQMIFETFCNNIRFAQTHERTFQGTSN